MTLCPAIRTPEKVIFTWSGGKDSALSLHEIINSGCYEVAALMTIVTQCTGRVCMHGVRDELLERQVESLSIPLEKVCLTTNASDEECEMKFGELHMRYKDKGVKKVVFGDIFLEDLKKYREDNLAEIGMEAVFPIWKRDTGSLARRFIELGFKAVVTCVDTKHLDERFTGMEFDERFLSELPPEVDPCGENGEFHSFVYAGPILKEPIPIRRGDITVQYDRFHFCDLIPC